jgi:hypothetical protein
MESPLSNGWNEWSRHVLAELERLNNCIICLEKDTRQMYEEIAMLKVKSGLWGLIGGLLPTVALLLHKLLTTP